MAFVRPAALNTDGSPVSAAMSVMAATSSASCAATSASAQNSPSTNTRHTRVRETFRFIDVILPSQYTVVLTSTVKPSCQVIALGRRYNHSAARVRPDQKFLATRQTSISRSSGPVLSPKVSIGNPSFVRTVTHRFASGVSWAYRTYRPPVIPVFLPPTSAIGRSS